MKDLILIIVFILLPHAIFAQSPSWIWASADINFHEGIVSGSGVTVDNSGNTYITGTTSVPNAAPDIFLAKYDPTGTLQWVKTGGGLYWDQGHGVTTDNVGNIYVTGRVGYLWLTYGSDTAHFGNHYVVTSNSEIVIVKYDPDGNVIWLKTQGGDHWDMGYGIKADKNGSIYVTGLFGEYPDSSVAYFDTISLKTNKRGDIFLAKYDTSGNVIWARSAGGSELDYAFSVGLDAGENVYLVGDHSSEDAWFGSYHLNSITTGFVTGNMFVAKYDSSGNFIWTRTAGGHNVNPNNPASVTREAGAVSSDGSVYVVGTFFGCNMYFGMGVYVTNEPGQTQDVFLAKYDTDGVLQWATGIATEGEDFAVGVTASNDHVYVTGQYSHDLPIGNDTLHGAGGSDVFILKSTSAGTFVWGKDIASNGGENSFALALDDTGENLYAAGVLGGDSIAFDSHVINTGNVAKYFVARMGTTVGVDNTELFAPTITIHPNPSDGSFTITNNKGLKGQLVVMNTMGARVYTTSIQAGETQKTLALQHLSAGCYFLSFRTGKGVVNKKIIIQ